MKKVIAFMIILVCLLAGVQASAEELLASFTFDSLESSLDGGNAAAVEIGDPDWVDNYAGHDGVMYFDGDDALDIFKNDEAGSSLLSRYPAVTVSFDFLNTGDYGSWNNDNWKWMFSVVPNEFDGNIYWSKSLGIATSITDSDSDGQDCTLKVRGERAYNSAVTANAVDCVQPYSAQWHNVEVRYNVDGMELYIDSDLVASNSNAVDLLEILGDNPRIILGSWPSSQNGFKGYIDNLRISSDIAPIPTPIPTPAPTPTPPPFALNPFNNHNDRQPSLYWGMELKEQGSANGVNRLIVPIPDNHQVTLPSDETIKSGFTFNDKTYVIEGEPANPRKLIGWYNIANGEYYSVIDGPVTVTLNENDVLYADWIAEDYDFMPENEDGSVDTTGTIDTADTSGFVDINVFDYSDLVNVNSMNVNQNGVNSESWSVYDNRENGYLAFSDWGTYQNEGSIGFPYNRTEGSPNGYNGGAANQGLLKPADKIINTIFSTSSIPDSDGYIPGINYLGKGNYLFSYDAATGMYSYKSSEDGAIYQKSEGRFYVFDEPSKYISGGTNNNFFPLNNPNQKLEKENGVPNFWFGMSVAVDFWLPDNSGTGGNQITTASGDETDMIFTFSGDDDLWVLIDGEVVLDIGGIHQPVNGSINFSTGEVEVAGKDTLKYHFTAGDHKMEIYYLERGGDLSNCNMQFNLLPEYEVEDPGLDTVKIKKDWVQPAGITKPTSISVELFDKNNPSKIFKTATLVEGNNWEHAFSNLQHEDENGNVISYLVRESGTGEFYDVEIVEGEPVRYERVWVFTDHSGLQEASNLVIGNGNGQVLGTDGADLVTYDVAEMDTGNNIIVKLASSDAAAAKLLWTLEPAVGYPGGKHFYLKNSDGQYLCIGNTKDSLHLHDDPNDASIYYFNASGDLQDATTHHRLVATESGFEVEVSVSGNVTTESANNVSLYVMRESETTAYSFTLTNTYLNPEIGIRKVDQYDMLLSGASIQLTDAENQVVAEWTSAAEVKMLPVAQAQYAGSGTIKLSEGGTKYVYTVTETAAPSGYKMLTAPISFYVEHDDGTLYVKDSSDNHVISKYVYNEETETWALSGGTQHITLVNEAVIPMGILTISKTVGGNAASADDEFVFTVQLVAPVGTAFAPIFPYTLSDGTTGTMMLDDMGRGTITLKGGQSASLNLPAETKYIVTEEFAAGYEMTVPESGSYTGEIAANATSQCPFTNVKNLYSLTVNKVVAGNAADETKKFAFTVVLTDANDVPLTGTFGGYTFDAQGKCTISIAHGGSFTIADLPDGAKFAITEEKGDYTITAPALDGNGAYTGAINTANATVTFTNELWAVDIEKQTEGLKDGVTVSPKVTVGDTVIDALPSNAQTPVRIYVTPGAEYSVTEENADVPGYTLTSATLTSKSTGLSIVSDQNGMGFTFPAAGMEDIPLLTITNTYAQGGLTISKTVAGNAASEEDEFIFTVQLTAPEGTTLADSYNYTLSDNTSGTMRLNGGVGTITLKGGQSASFDALPTGTTYIVSEAPAEGVTGYTKTAPTEGTVSGTITTKASSVSFTNVRDVVRLVKVTNPNDLTVAPAVTISGSDGSSASSAALTANDDTVWLEIPVKPGVTYTVTESGYEIDDYTFLGNSLSAAHANVTVNGMAFEVAQSGMTDIPVLTLENRYSFDEGGLIISKNVIGQSSDAKQESFAFTVTLKDEKGNPVSGTFGEFEFVNGVCGTIALKDGQSVVITGIPAGTVYTVTEAAKDGFVQVGPTGENGEVLSAVTGEIVTNGSNNVTFTNAQTYIKLRKVTEGLLGSDKPAQDVTITLTGSNGDESAVAVTADGDYAILPIVAGEYALTESGYEVPGYVCISSKLTDSKGAVLNMAGAQFEHEGEYTLTNVYAMGSLSLTKEVEGAAPAYGFDFTATFAHDALDVSKYINCTVDGAAFTLPADGKVTLRHGQTLLVEQLPIGTTYTITEAADNRYAHTGTTGEPEGVVEDVEQIDVVFTNKAFCPVLSVSKTVGGNAADPTDSFTFLVSLKDGGKAVTDTLTYTLSADVTDDSAYEQAVYDSEAGGYLVNLTGGQKATFIALTPGWTYEVTEQSANEDNYVLEGNAIRTGVLPQDRAAVDYVNVRNAVYVNKVAEGLAEGDSVSPEVKINGESIGTLTSGGESILVYLTPGTHTLEETGYEKGGYSFVGATLTASSGVQITPTDGQTTPGFTFTLQSGLTSIPLVTIHNEYTSHSGSLIVSKTVTGNASAETDVFTFTISLAHGTQPLTGSYPVQLFQGDAPVSSSMLAFNADGKATVALSHGQRAVITGLPLGAAYTVVETPADGYVQTSVTGDQGTIVEEKAYMAEFVNTKNVFSGLTVTKTIIAENPSTTDSFTFTVKLTDPEGKPVTGEFPCTGIDAATLAFNSKGEASFKLRHGQSAVISGLPFGTAYTVTEKEERSYELTHSTGASGVIDADGETAAFQNTYASNLPSLTISKAIEGNAASAQDEFSFTITMKDRRNQPLTGSYHYTKATASGSSNGVLILDESGSAVLTLKADESLTLIKLPVGASYTVTENVDPALGYTASEPVISGVIPNASTKASAAFTNIKHTALSIVKTAKSTPALASYPAPMVSLYKADSEGNKIGNALCTVQLTANGSAVPLNAELEPNTLYLIEESGHTLADFDVTAELRVNGTPANGMTFIAEPGAQTLELALSNTYTGLYGPLTISKTVNGAGGGDARFEFTVTLTDDKDNPLTGSYAYSGTLDGKQAVSGSITSGGTITLMDGGSITIGKLPIGTAYTVTEKEDLLYRPDQKTYGGVIDHDSEAVAFVNVYYSILPALKVEKHVQGNAASQEDMFRFTVTMTDKASGKPVSGVISCLNEKDEAYTITLDEHGSYTFQLAHGESVTFIKLPVNVNYTVSEENGMNGYALVSSVNATGSIIDDQAFITSSFVNERNAEATIAKSAKGLLAGAYPAPRVSIYREGDMLTPVWSGTLAPNGASAKIGQLPAGNYVLVESAAAVNGYSCTAELSVNGSSVMGDPFTGVHFTVQNGQTALTLLVTNTYTPDDISLKIFKRSVGLPQEYAYPAPKVSIFAAGNLTTPVWTGTLTPNGSAQTLELQPGKYTLVEQIDDVGNYSFSSVLYVDGSASLDNTFTLVPGMATVSLQLDNTYAAAFSTLTLSKTVTGDAGSKDLFTFAFTLTDGANASITGSFPYTGTLDGMQSISGVITNGSTVALRDGGSITVKLPLDVHYKVAELTQEGYVLVSATGTEGVITPDGAAAAFVNKRQYSVVVSKEWFDDNATERPSFVQVQLLLDGAPIGEPVTLSKENGWQHTFTGLESSGPYTVEELNAPDGYVSTVDEIQKNVFVITNSIITIPPTGDDSNPAFYGLAMLGSAVLLCLLLRRRRHA